MSHIDLKQPLVASVLDRLLETDAETRADRTQSAVQRLTELRQAVRRDLEALLNTRSRCLSWPKTLAELDRSIVGYGAPDSTSANLSSAQEREAFRAELETVIRRYEPRFVSVEIRLLNNADETDRTLRLRIEALMYAEPAPEPMIFDSHLDPASRTFLVTSANNA